MNHGLRQARIIHLTDIHFGSSHVFQQPLPADGGAAANRGVPSLLEMIRRDLESADFAGLEWRSPRKANSSEPAYPCVVALTGDLTQHATDDEFAQATAFLRELQQRPLLGETLRSGDIFVVPGNHDVIFDQIDDGKRWFPFCRFYEAHAGHGVRPDAAQDLTRIIDRSDDGLIVAEINSCFYVKKATPDSIRGQVDQAQVTRLREALRLIDSKKREHSIKIALMHHHPVLLPTLAESGRGCDAIVNSPLLLATLREFGFHLVLHGHKHNPHTFLYDAVCAWSEAPHRPTMIISGGSASSTSLEPDGRNTYNVILVKWNPHVGHARVRVVTRGLVRKSHLPINEWFWETLRIDDRSLALSDGLPPVGASKNIPLDAQAEHTFETERRGRYVKLRGNMPVIEVMPSLLPDQAYEARVWLVQHPNKENPAELPVSVTWSAGPNFLSAAGSPVTVETHAGPQFCTKFEYWGPMNIQARMRFDDGHVATASIYARVPGK